MKSLFIFLFLVLFLNNCVKESAIITPKIETDEIESQMIKSYEEGVNSFNKKLYLEAAKKFNEAEILFPQSEWAPKASLMAAYSYYTDNYNNDAIRELQGFFKKYPNDTRIAYAHYLLAMSHYNNIVDEKKDLQPLLNSKTEFEYVVENFPNTDFSLDSKFKLDLINEMIASKEMYIARHYLNKQKWIPAINRLKFIVKEYDDTIFVEEALHRLVEVYYKIGLENESKKYAILLGHNYPESQWYKTSFKIHNKNYKLERDKKKNKFTIKKFKSLF
tara:strand:- start:437 stop:1261 length:825 start_codon:yes stop_codon:yes gene_type:complete